MMRNRFDQQLEQLHADLITMGGLCETAIAAAVDAATKGDGDMAKAAIADDSKIDEMERSIEHLCLKLLLQQQPVARDLRTISSAMKMVTDLQRIGDQAANIAEIALLLADGKQNEVPEDIATMSRQAGLMVRQAIAAFADRDENTAHAVINLDDVVDDLFVKVKRELTERIARQEDHSGNAVDLIIIAKYLERIADHAVNIAKWAIFCVTGEL